MDITTASKIVLSLLTYILAIKSIVERHVETRKRYVKDKWWFPGMRTFILAVKLGFTVALMGYLLNDDSTAFTPWTLSEVVAITAAITGGILRTWSMKVLGRHFTFEVAIRDRHKLIKTGPYRILRHPSYTGAVLCFWGFFWYLGGPNLMFRQYIPNAIGLLIGAIVLALRISNEEEVLASHFKREWDEYCKTRWRLFPFIW